MRRLFWLAVGAGAGLYAQRKAMRLARSLTPQNLAVKAVNTAVKTGGTTTDRIRNFTDDVRTHMAEREAELREAIQLDQAPPIDPRKRKIIQARALDDSKDGTHGVG